MIRLENYKYSEYRKYIKRIYENSFAKEENSNFLFYNNAMKK